PCNATKVAVSVNPRASSSRRRDGSAGVVILRRIVDDDVPCLRDQPDLRRAGTIGTDDAAVLASAFCAPEIGAADERSVSRDVRLDAGGKTAGQPHVDRLH